jgi:hypothetical protein
MTIEFQFTLDDYRNAFRAHYRKGAAAFTRWLMKLSVLAGVVFLLIGMLMLVTGQRPVNVWLTPLVIGGLWAWIGMGGSYQLSAKKQFEKNPMLREPAAH